MQTNTRNIFTLGMMASAAAALVACGGGDSGTPTPTPTPVTVQGKAVDFYLAQATVTFLDCSNKTVTTKANGDFTFPDGCTTSALKVTGGTDIGTNQPFTGVLQAPAVAYKAGVTPVVTPLTTLVAQLGSAQAAALATKLGLQGKDLSTLDPMNDAAVLKASVVVQQLVDQIAKTLAGLSKTTGGTLTAEAAAAAAASAVASAVNAGSGTADLTSGVLVSTVITSAVQNAKAGFPASVQSNIAAVAANVAALAGPVVASQVANVSAALGTIVLGVDPTATLATLRQSGSVNAVVDSAKSTASNALVAAVTPAALGDPALTGNLANLGAAVATGNAGKIQAAAGALGGNVNSGAINEVANSVKPTDFIQLASLNINGGVFPVTDAVTVGGGTLNAIKVAVSQNGKPFGDAAPEVRAGLSYSYNGNNVDVIIEKVVLTFNGSQLTGATVPANTTYSFRIGGGNITAGTSLTSSVADNLFDPVNSGSLNLPFTVFLGKLKSAGGLSASDIDALTPKSTSTFPVTFAVAGQSGKAVSVGTVVSGSAQKTQTQTVQTLSSTVSGNGIKVAVTLNP
ncbi:membrane protein [Burkholderiaceae bacterium 16]|nr:membrane protein [Burkholderiaceae bacterium 16]